MPKSPILAVFVWLVSMSGFAYLLLNEYLTNGCIRSRAICNQFDPVSIGSAVHILLFVVIAYSAYKLISKYLG